MNEEEFDRWVEACAAELAQKQKALEAAYGLAAMKRWFLDQESGYLNFYDERDVLKVRFPVTPIGTWARLPESWKWAWANQKISAVMRGKAESLKALHAATDFDLFLEAGEQAADEVMAWELAAVAVKHLNAAGCYRAPNQDVWLFLALDAPR